MGAEKDAYELLEDDLLEHLGERLAASFPGLAPAIATAWRHLLDTDPKFMTWRGLDGAAPAEGSVS